MPVDKNVPKWLRTYIRRVQKVLRLEHWSFTTELTRVVNDETNAFACTHPSPGLWNARIEFSVDVPAREADTHAGWWKLVVIHELLHLAHGRVDHVVEGVLLAALSEGAARQVAQTAYTQHMEQFVHQQAQIIEGLLDAADRHKRKADKARKARKRAP